MLRTATIADLNSIMEIEESLFPMHVRSSRSSILRSIQSTIQKVLVLELDSVIVGCAILFQYSKSYRIYSIGILSSYQGLGHGKKIMNQIIDLANENKVNLILEVEIANLLAISFYESFGFTIIRTLSDYYGANLDGYKMIKKYKFLKISNTLVIVEQDLPWLKDIENIEIIHSNEYISNEEYDKFSNRVFNLCDSYKYQSTGYYVSLLANAREQQVIPNITTIKDLMDKRILRSIAEEIDELIQDDLKNIEFAASQMDRILREHQALSRINQSSNNEGMSNLFAKDKTPMNKGNATVRTRNSRI